MESLSPFLQGSFIPYNKPVYPGALRFARRPPGIAALPKNLRTSANKLQHINLDIVSDILPKSGRWGGWKIKSWQCSVASSPISF